MKKLYKLTDFYHYTHNNTPWGENVTHMTNGIGDMCGPGWLHAYESPLLAVLLNPIHANFNRPVLWEAKGIVGISDGLKVGCTKLTTIIPIQLPEITAAQRTSFAILCTLELHRDSFIHNMRIDKYNHFMKWANNWLSGKDRTIESADIIKKRFNSSFDYIFACCINSAIYEHNSIYAAQAANYASCATQSPKINFVELAEKAISL